MTTLARNVIPRSGIARITLWMLIVIAYPAWSLVAARHAAKADRARPTRRNGVPTMDSTASTTELSAADELFLDPEQLDVATAAERYLRKPSGTSDQGHAGEPD